MRNEAIDLIIDTALKIKLAHREYLPQQNLRWPVTVFMRFTVHESNDEKINGMIYYSYLLYVGCLYE